MKVLRGIILFVGIVHLLGLVSYAQEGSLTLWIMPNESPIDQRPSDEQIEQFLGENKNLINTSDELRNDRDFARAVLGQSKILELIRRYRQEKGFTGLVNVRILKWPDAFGEISDAAAICKERSSPDIVQLGSTWTAYFADQKALVEITDYVDEKLYFEPSIKSCKILGSEKIYALPLIVDVRALYYWKDVIDNPEVDLRDWQAMEKTCSRIQGLIDRGELPGMMAPLGFPTAKDWDLLHQFSLWLWGAGGEVVEFEKVLGIFPVKRAGLDSKEALAAADLLKDLTKASSLPEFHLAELEERFTAGHFGMIVSGEWMIRRLQGKLGKDWKDRVGIALPPAGSAGRSTFVGGSNLAILKSKERSNPKMALDFLSFLLSKEIQVEYAKATGSFPALKEAMDECVTNNSSYHIFKEAIEHGKSYPSLPEWATVVEKEMTLNNLYRFWQDIRNNMSDDKIKDRLEIADGFLDLELFWKKVISLTIFLLVTVCLLALFLWLLKSFLKRKKAEREKEKLMLEINEHKSKIQSYSDHLQDMMGERKRLKEKLDDEKIELEEYQSKTKGLELSIQKYHSKIEDVKRRIQILEKEKYALVIFLKQLPEEKGFVEYLLHLENIIEVVVKDNYDERSMAITGLEKPEYKNEKRLFLLMAYMTHFKNLYISPATITDTGKTTRRQTPEEKLFLTNLEKRWITRGEEKYRMYGPESIKQWIRRLRKDIFKNNPDLIPESKRGYKINAQIAFEVKNSSS